MLVLHKALCGSAMHYHHRILQQTFIKKKEKLEL